MASHSTLWRYASSSASLLFVDGIQPELCHVVRVLSVNLEINDHVSQSISRLASGQASAYELPTCPVCLERMDSAVTGLITVPCSHTFHCMCLSKWGDSRYQYCLPFPHFAELTQMSRMSLFPNPNDIAPFHLLVNPVNPLRESHILPTFIMFLMLINHQPLDMFDLWQSRVWEIWARACAGALPEHDPPVLPGARNPTGLGLRRRWLRSSTYSE